MMEYVFFHETLRRRFVDYARSLAVMCIEWEDHDSMIVAVPEDLTAEAGEALERCYDGLLDEESNLADAADGAALQHVVGVQVMLADGRRCTVRLDPGIVNRVLGCLDFEEFQGLVTTIAHAVENPSDAPLCKK